MSDDRGDTLTNMTDMNAQPAPSVTATPDVSSLPAGAPVQPPTVTADTAVQPPAAPTAAGTPHESKWAGVVKGAMAGLIQGGIPGFAAGVADPAAARQALANKRAMSTEAAKQARLTTDLHHVQLVQAQRQLETSPKTVQEKYINTAIDQNEPLIRAGAMVPISGTFADKSPAIQALQDAHQANSALVFDIRPVRDDKGGVSYQVMQYPHAPLQEDVTIPGPDGKNMKVPKGTPADQVGRFMTVGMSQFLKTQGALTVLGAREQGNLQLEGVRQGNRKELQGMKNAHDEVSPARTDKSYQFHSSALDKLTTPIEDRLRRVDNLKTSLDQNNPQADALIAPELLTTMAGGQGSGLRMNEAEISRIVGGRNHWEDLKSAALKWQTDPSKPFLITPDQRQQVRGLVSAVEGKLRQKQQILEDGRQKLIDTEDPAEHRQVYAQTRRLLAAIDTGTQSNKVPQQKPQPATSTAGGSFFSGIPGAVVRK